MIRKRYLAVNERIYFKLKPRLRKPSFVSVPSSTNYEFTCMLDTGAGIPVWCTGESNLVNTFSGVSLKDDLVSIVGGFGKGLELMDVYYVPQIRLCGTDNDIVLQNVYLPVTNRPNYGIDMILPSSIFKNSKIVLLQLGEDEEGFSLQSSLEFICRTKIFKLSYTRKLLSVREASAMKSFYSANGKDQNMRKRWRLGSEGEFDRILMQDLEC